MIRSVCTRYVYTVRIRRGYYVRFISYDYDTAESCSMVFNFTSLKNYNIYLTTIYCFQLTLYEPWPNPYLKWKIYSKE